MFGMFFTIGGPAVGEGWCASEIQLIKCQTTRRQTNDDSERFWPNRGVFRRRFGLWDGPAEATKHPNTPNRRLWAALNDT